MDFLAYNERMRKFFILFIFLFPLWSFAAAPSITVFPERIIQGEPFRVVVENVSGASAVRIISFNGRSLGIVLYQGKPTAFIGIDLNKKPADYKITVTLADGSVLKKTITIGSREKVEAPVGIPEKLGGNTPQAAKAVVSSLAQENKTIYSVRTIPKQLWTGSFNFPFSNPIVTDTYGYSRQTVGQVITHKGTDFRAKEGTSIAAMNRGIVRFAKNTKIYGNTVILDHGLGLHTVYMHLSKIKVNEGELVKQGQLLGLSGKTGYVVAPHLHLSVWIDKVSIDPMKFMELF